MGLSRNVNSLTLVKNIGLENKESRPAKTSLSLDIRRNFSSGKSPETMSSNQGTGLIGTLKGLKETAKTYGMPFFIYYNSLWAAGVGVAYYALLQDYIPWSSCLDFLQMLKFPAYFVDLDTLDPNVGKLPVALVMNECFEVVRFPFWLVTIRPILRKMGRIQ